MTALLFLALLLTRNAQVRYALGVGALVLMALCPLATFLFLGTPPATVTNAVPDYPSVTPAISNMTVVLSSASPVTSFDLLSSLVWVWCSGVCLFGFRAFGGWLVLQRLRRTAQEAVSSELLERCRRLQQRIGIAGVVRYAYSEMVEAPAVLGWFRPVVLIPISALAGLSVEQLEAIIAHELAHVRRYDALVNLFQIAAETVLFYHPAVWWVNRVIRTERENCCDDIAVAVCGNASEYARALAMMSGGSSRPTWAMAANGGALKARVGRLLGMQKIAHGIPRAGLAMLAVFCASCVVLAAGVFKQDVPGAPPAPPPPPSEAVQVPAPPPPPEPPVVETMEQQKMLRDIQQQLKRTLSKEQLQNLEREIKQQEKLARELGRQQALEAEAKRSISQQQVKDLQRAVASMQERYNDESPELRDAREQLQALVKRGLDEFQVEPEQKSAEPKGPSYIDSLESVGLTKLSVDDLIALKIQGVTADYVAR